MHGGCITYGSAGGYAAPVGFEEGIGAPPAPSCCRSSGSEGHTWVSSLPVSNPSLLVSVLVDKRVVWWGEGDRVGSKQVLQWGGMYMLQGETVLCAVTGVGIEILFCQAG